MVMSESIKDGQNDSKLTMSDGERVTISKKMIEFVRSPEESTWME